jgi:hypothetical protein
MKQNKIFFYLTIGLLICILQSCGEQESGLVYDDAKNISVTINNIDLSAFPAGSEMHVSITDGLVDDEWEEHYSYYYFARGSGTVTPGGSVDIPLYTPTGIPFRGVRIYGYCIFILEDPLTRRRIYRGISRPYNGNFDIAISTETENIALDFSTNFSARP